MRSAEFKKAKRHAWLVSHGQEHIALGGPTTRLRQIEQTALAQGHAISSTANGLDLLKHSGSVSVAHVFNSWALQSAITTLSLARRTRQPVVFSPIVLNLADRAFYDQGVKSLLARATCARDVEDGAMLIQSRTPAWTRDTSSPPRQGIASHYESLRRQVALADKLICLSAYERDLLESIGISTETASIVPNGVDTGIMRNADPDLFYQTFGITDFVLMVGRIEPRKNQALPAFALRDLGLPVVCIGHVGDPDYFEQLKKWAGPNFVHVDRISDRRLLASAYKAARVLLLASWSEGAPLVALEAAAAGTPLVLSTMSSEQDYFGTFATYVHPADLDGIRAEIASLSAAPETPALRAARSQFAQDRFSIERHVDRTLAVYDEVTGAGAWMPAPEPASAPHLDVTQLAHHIHNRKHLTGVPAVEKEIAAALISLQPAIGLSAWSSRSRLSEAIPTAAFATEAMGKLADKSAPDSESFDLSCERAEVSVNTPKFKLFGLLPSRGPGPRRRMLTVLKHVLNAMPNALRDRALKVVHARRPGFSLEIAPQHYLLESARIQHASSQVTGSHAGQVHLSVFERPQARPPRLRITKGTRYIVLGHAWISNDQYLQDLVETVSRDDLKLWVHVPDILYVTRPGTFSETVAANFTRRLKTVLAIADTIITISAQSETEIRAFAESCGYRPDILRVTLGVPPQTLGAGQSAQRETGAENQVLYVASMSERKRHDFLIDAWIKAREASPQVASARLVLVGQPLPGYDRFGDRTVQKQLAQFGISIINDCDAYQLAQRYQDCMFTVYPSAAEGWGLPPVESLSVGKPCLVSDTLPVAVDIVSGGLKPVSTDSGEAWVTALCAWLDSPEELKKATRAAAAFTPPSWEDAARKLLTN